MNATTALSVSGHLPNSTDFGRGLFLEVEDDLTNRTVRLLQPDGGYTPVLVESRTEGVTATHIGIGCRVIGFTTVNPGATLYDWGEVQLN